MIDTTAINFGIAKLSQEFEKAAPTLQSVGTKYVHYVVAKAIIMFPICLILLSVLIAVELWLIKKAKKSIKEGGDEVLWGVGCIFVGLAVVGFFIATMCSGYNMALAIWCPDMYTIDQVIDAAKNK